uniref:Ig-like domain-containing protein n=1 Tax=Emticicia sp. TaxID=1930953 RepID=UPI003BA5CE0D
KFIKNGFVFYRATNSNATNDAFVVSGKIATGGTVSEEIKINFVRNMADLPCYAGTIGDKATVEAGKTTEINVTANDKTCSTIGENTLKIEIPPANGKAEIIDRKVIYTPNSDFIGEDVFFYRMGINNNKNPVAPVEISVIELKECTNGMTDDILNVLSYSPNSDLVIDVLQNDKICANYQKAELKVITNPAVGDLRIGKNNAGKQVIYYKSAIAPKGIQTFEYALYRTEKAFIKAKVTVNFN